MKLRQNAYSKAVLAAHGMTKSRALPSTVAKLHTPRPGRRVDIGGVLYVWHPVTGSLLLVKAIHPHAFGERCGLVCPTDPKALYDDTVAF